MSDRLDDKIRGFVAELVNDPPVTPEIDFENQESPGVVPFRQRSSHRRRVPAVVAVGAACVVLVAVGLPVLFFGGSDSIVDVESAATVTSAISTTVATVPAPPQLDAWQRVGVGLMNPVVGLLDIAAADSRLVALGFDPGGDYRQDGVVFASENGIEWTRLAADDPALKTGTVLMYGIAEGGPGLVAGGMSCEDNEFPCLAGPYPTVWTSTDGTAWTRTIVEQGERIGAVLDVLVTDYGIVATGGFTQPTPDGGTSSSAAAWLSVDGISWSRVWQGTAVRDSGFGSGPGAGALALASDGLIAGAGSAYNESGEGVAAVWISTDAVDWTRVDPESAVFASDAGHRAFMSDIVWGPTGFVAVGGDGSRAAVWTSSDGVTWARIDIGQEPMGLARPLSALAVLDGGYVAAGPDGNSELVTLWTSTDGISWDRVQVLGEGNAEAIVSSEDGIAVVGQTPSNDDYHAAVWMGPAFDPAQPPSDPIPTSQDEPASMTPLIESVPAGRSCETIAADGFSYAEAVSYWMQYEMPPGFNLDTNAVPCEASYPTSEIAGVFGDPAAASVTLVSNHATQSFVATGAAVDADLICAAGAIVYTDDPEPTEPGVRWRWEDRYICSNGSGTFLLGVDEYIDDGAAMYGVWNIVSGTGAYEGLNGGGGTDSVLDDYDASTGRLWFEIDGN